MRVSQLLAERFGPVLSTEPAVTAHDVAKTLWEHKVGLLVLCGTRRGVVGMVSEHDIIRGPIEVAAYAISAKVSI